MTTPSDPHSTDHNATEHNATEQSYPNYPNPSEHKTGEERYPRNPRADVRILPLCSLCGAALGIAHDVFYSGHGFYPSEEQPISRF